MPYGTPMNPILCLDVPLTAKQLRGTCPNLNLSWIFTLRAVVIDPSIQPPSPNREVASSPYVNIPSNSTQTSYTFTLSVPAPKPTKNWNFTFNAQCANGTILTASQYPQHWDWFDGPTTQHPAGTSQPLTIAGIDTSTYYLLTQPDINSPLLVPKTYPAQMSIDPSNSSRLKWIGSNLPSGNYTITMTAPSSACATPPTSLTCTLSKPFP